MGFFDSAKAGLKGNLAYRTHAAASQLAKEGKPSEAKAKYQEALKLYAEAVQAGCNRPNILQGYATLMMREDWLEEGREMMLKIEKIRGLTKDDWFRLRLNYSIYQWRSGELDKAIATIRRAAGDGMNSAVYTTLGMYLVDKARETGEYEEALAFNQEAMEYDDEDAATLDNMGQLYLLMSRDSGEEAGENRRKALDYFKRAYRVHPRQITTVFFLGRMLHEDGEDEKARKVLSDWENLYYSALCPVKRDEMASLAKEIGL